MMHVVIKREMKKANNFRTTLNEVSSDFMNFRLFPLFKETRYFNYLLHLIETQH